MTAKNVTAEASTGDIISKHKEYIWPCAATYYEQPLALERGEGMHVWDPEGNRYLDCFGGVAIRAPAKGIVAANLHQRGEAIESSSDCVVVHCFRLV